MPFYQAPEICRVIQVPSMAEFVDHQILDGIPWNKQQLIVQADSAARRATAPARFLATNGDFFVIKASL